MIDSDDIWGGLVVIGTVLLAYSPIIIVCWTAYAIVKLIV